MNRGFGRKRAGIEGRFFGLVRSVRLDSKLIEWDSEKVAWSPG
jgi:hypothetical protein